MSRPRLRTLFGGAAVLVLLTPGAAFAHEQRQVGAISFTVGWQHEPTYAGSENAVQLFLKDAKGNPIDDLGDPPSLQVQVITGNQTSDPLALAPSFDEDTGLATLGIGSRGAGARSLFDRASGPGCIPDCALGSLAVLARSYSGALGHYRARFPGLGADAGVFVAETDTIARSFMATMSAAARRYACY